MGVIKGDTWSRLEIHLYLSSGPSCVTEPISLFGPYSIQPSVILQPKDIF